MSLSNQYSVIPGSLYLQHESLGWDCVSPLDLKGALAESRPPSSLTPPFLGLSRSDSRTALSEAYADILLAHHLV